MKGLPICFSEVQVKNDVTDNNNKHFVTAFEGECRNIIELREHLKLCFLIILVRVYFRGGGGGGSVKVMAATSGYPVEMDGL